MSIKVLCVDDSVDLSRLITIAISAADDMEVAGVLHSADDLINEVRSRSPDVLLLDLSMPGHDGIELLSRLRVDSPDTRVVVFSGHDDPQTVEQAIAAGASRYLSKSSVGMNSLLDAVRQVARRQDEVSPS